MACHPITTPCGRVSGWLCIKNIYRYRGYLFEWHNYLGPCALREDFEPRKNIKKGFWDAVTEFAALSKQDSACSGFPALLKTKPLL